MRSGGHWTTLGLLLRRGGRDNGRPGINYTLSDAGRSSRRLGEFDEDPAGSDCLAAYDIAIVTRPTQHDIIPIIGK